MDQLEDIVNRLRVRAEIRRRIWSTDDRIARDLDEAAALIEAADALRAAQRAYMADRGNEEKGRAVALAAAAYDGLR